MIRTTLAGLVLACSTSAHPSIPQDPDTTQVRWVDVRDVLEANWQDVGGLNMLWPTAIQLDELEPDQRDFGLRVPTWEPTLIDLASIAGDLLSPLEEGPVGVATIHGGHLRLEGEPDGLDRVEAWLRSARESLDRRLRYEWYLLEQVPVEWGAVVPGDALDAWLAETGRVPDHTLSGRASHRAHLNAEASRSIVCDYDVETAQYLAFVDPQISKATDAEYLGALTHELTDGRLFVHAWSVRSAVVGEPRHLQLFEGEPGTNEYPTLDSKGFHGSAVMRSGDALLVSCPGSDGRHSLLRVVRESPAEPVECWLPTGLLLAPPLRYPGVDMLGALVSGGIVPAEHLPFEEEPEPLLDERELLDQIHDETSDRDARSDWVTLHSAVHGVAGPGALAEARKELASFEDLVDRTVELDLRFGLLDPDTWASLRGEHEDPSAWLDALEHRHLFASHSGESAHGSAGRDHYYRMDYDVEISGGAHAPDPILGHVRTGSEVCMTPHVRPDGRVSAWVAFGLCGERNPFTTRSVFFQARSDHESFQAPDEQGFIEVPDLYLFHRRTHLTREPDVWFPLLTDRLRDPDQVLVAVARFRVHGGD